jgi:hypothetical protein
MFCRQPRNQDDWMSSGMLRRVVSQKLTDVLEAVSRAIALMMEAVSTSETSVNFHKTTRCNIPEGCHLHNRRRENLKSHLKDAGLFSRPRELWRHLSLKKGLKSNLPQFLHFIIIFVILCCSCLCLSVFLIANVSCLPLEYLSLNLTLFILF